MDILGKILGVLIFINFAICLWQKNIAAVGGWLVAGLEWTRRITS